MATDSKEDARKRLFFGIEVAAPWPEQLPRGRLLEATCRHTTIAFLGNIPYAPLQNLLPQLPLPPMTIGPTGKFDTCLFLPPKRPNVVAWHVQWDQREPLLAYQRQLTDWLREHGFELEVRDYLPHVTLARWPFEPIDWKAVSPVRPLFGRALHLYESMGNLRYEARWTHPFIAPFVELSHTADIAFLIRGENLQQIFFHAQLALSFEYPQLLSYLQPEEPGTLDALIQALNRLISRADAALGVPLKAVSYHGALFQDEKVLAWEMIVDV